MLAFLTAPFVALTLAVLVAVPCAVVAVAVFGVAHLGLETRYLAGRFSIGVSPGVVALLLVPLTLIALGRLMGWGIAGARLEAVIAFAVLALAWALLARRRPGARSAGLAVCGLLALAAVRRPDLYLVAIAQLHNLVPLAFLLDWARSRGSASGRVLFRLAQVGWAFVIPLLILAGTFDRWLAGWGLLAWGGDRSAGAVAAVYSPAGWSGPWPARFLAVFAFGQLMHYVIWCGYLPAVARPEHRQAAAAPVAGPGFRPGRFVAIVAVVALAVGALQLVIGADGRRLYSALASYHVYLEYPILALLAAGLVAGLPGPQSAGPSP